MSTTVQTSLRNADLTDLVTLLREQHDLKYDMVASTDKIRFVNGNLVVLDGISEVVGVSEAGEIVENTVDAVLRPTDVFDGGISQRLKIPRDYLRRMRDEATGADGQLDPEVYAALLDHNVNTWLDHQGGTYLVRGFLASGDQEGIARAFLSSKHAQYDNLDGLFAFLEGAKRTGAHLEVVSADLTERRCHVRVACPEIRALAPELLKGYRNPFVDNPQRGGWTLERAREAAAREGMGYKPGEEPIVFAGFDYDNSETGNGRAKITPVLTVEACSNGLKINIDAFGKVHIGGRLDEGVIDWSSETQRVNIELFKSQTADAVARFISPDYVKAKLAEIEEKAGVVISKPKDVLEKVGKQFGISAEEQDLILSDFIAGGQPTAGGILNAVTSAAQRVEDPDRAGEIEDVALEVFAAVAS